MGIVISASKSRSANKTEGSDEVHSDIILQGMTEEEEYCDGTKKGTMEIWNFSKHSFYVEMQATDSPVLERVLRWELKDITANYVIDSGSWTYGSDDPETPTREFKLGDYKRIIDTTDRIGHTIRLRMWSEDGQTMTTLWISVLSAIYFT